MQYVVWSDWEIIVFCKQKTAYEIRISDLSSDVCSSDLSCVPIPRTSRSRRIGRSDSACKGRQASQARTDRLAGLRYRLTRTARSPQGRPREIGGASCRERVCQYTSIRVVAVSSKNITNKPPNNRHTSIYNSTNRP